MVVTGVLGDGGAEPTATVYASRFSGTFGSMPVTTAHTLLNPSEGETVAVNSGYYLWWAEDTAGQRSALVYQAATDAAATAVLDRILTSVVLVVQSLNLDGVRTVERLKIPLKTRLDDLPSVFVTAYNRAEQPRGGSNLRDDIAYPVYVFHVSRTPDDGSTESRDLLVRERIMRAFRSQPLQGVEEVMTCEIEPDPVFEWDERISQLQISALTLRFVAREPRGFGV